MCRHLHLMCWISAPVLRIPAIGGPVRTSRETHLHLKLPHELQAACKQPDPPIGGEAAPDGGPVCGAETHNVPRRWGRGDDWSVCRDALESEASAPLGEERRDRMRTRSGADLLIRSCRRTSPSVLIRRHP